MTTHINHSQLVTPSKTATILEIKETTLSQKRWRGDKSLPWVKIGKSVRYKLSDIEAYIERSTVGKGA